MGKASGVNPEEKSGAGVPKAVRSCIQRASGNSCDASGAKMYRPLPFLWIHRLRGEGEHAAWATSCSPYYPAQASALVTLRIKHQHVTPYTWRGHSNFAGGVDTTRKAAVYQLKVIAQIGVERGARGCFRRWERPSSLTGQLPPALNWAAPSQLGAVPPQSAFLNGCLGIKPTLTSRL